MVTTNKSEPILKGLMSIFPIGHDYERKELMALANEFEIRSVERGFQLWAEGLDQSKLYFIVSGSCGEYLRHPRGESLIRFYQDGKFAFSEDILLYSAPSESRCVALTKSVIASVPKVKLLDNALFDSVAAKLLGVLINLSMTEYRNTTYEMLQSSGKARLQAVIYQSPNLLNIIPRKELSDYLGVSRASLFRALKSFGNE